MPIAPAELAAEYFDGQQARPQPVRLRVQQGELQILGEGIALRLPVRQVRWPERQRHGARQAYLPGHGLVSHADAARWDAWASASGLRQGLVVHWMQSWRGALLALALLLATLWGGYHWGVPAAAQAAVALTPLQVDARLGALVQDQLDQGLLQDSLLPAAQQAAVRAAFGQALDRLASRDAAAALPAWTLHFRRMPAPGATDNTDPGLANALALPGGAIIVTDAMVLLLADRPDVLIGVLGHELGHVGQRHGMRLLVQAGLLAAVSSLVIGDFSSVLAAAPVLLGQAAYARAHEYEADAAAARLLRANGVAPAVMGVLFERLRALPGQGTAAGAAWPIGLASHPPDAERVRRMSAPG